jgi:hypothetical protein
VREAHAVEAKQVMERIARRKPQKKSAALKVLLIFFVREAARPNSSAYEYFIVLPTAAQNRVSSGAPPQNYTKHRRRQRPNTNRPL